MNRSSAFRIALLSLSLLASVSVLTTPVSAANLTVNSSGDTVADDGVCTLREAITASNDDTASGATAGECVAGSGADTINFNIPGAGIHRITPTTPLPDVSDSVNIDGTTQPGTSCEPRDLMIEIDSTTAYATGPYIVPLTFNSDNNTLQGLALFGEPDNLPNSGTEDKGITFQGADNIIRCNNFGITADNKQPSIELGYTNNSGGIRLVAHSDNTYIGGSTPKDRNIFGDTDIGVIVDSGSVNNRPDNIRILGNYFGTDVTGMVVFPNRQVDISVSSASNIKIGSSNSSERNIFAGTPIRGASIVLAPAASSGAGILGTKIQGNYFGLDPSGVARPGFASSKVAVHLINFPSAALGGTDSYSHQNLIGGSEPDEANTITGFEVGVMVTTAYFDFGGGPIYSTLPINNNTIIGNKIYGNDFGIELCGDLNLLSTTFCGTMDGPNPNDPGDPDTGANDYLNKPEITAISQIGNQITFTYDLDVIGSPSNQYRVEFFSNDTADSFGYGQGQNMLGASTATANGPATGLTATFTLPSDTDITGKVFASTATVVDSSLRYGFGSTSEFGTLAQDAVIDYEVANTDNIPNQGGATNAGNNNQAANQKTNAEGLASTGINQRLLIILATATVIVSGVLAVKSIRKKTSQA